MADATVLLHVVDITHPDAARQSQTVENTLADLGLAEKPRVTALNKVDALVDADGHAPRSLDDVAGFQEALAANIPGAVLISAEKRWGLEALRAALVGVIDRQRSSVER
jgi:GTP-binding protein HflX